MKNQSCAHMCQEETYVMQHVPAPPGSPQQPKGPFVNFSGMMPIDALCLLTVQSCSAWRLWKSPEWELNHVVRDASFSNFVTGRYLNDTTWRNDQINIKPRTNHVSKHVASVTFSHGNRNSTSATFIWGFFNRIRQMLRLTIKTVMLVPIKWTFPNILTTKSFSDELKATKAFIIICP